MLSLLSEKNIFNHILLKLLFNASRMPPSQSPLEQFGDDVQSECPGVRAAVPKFCPGRVEPSSWAADAGKIHPDRGAFPDVK